MLHIYGVYFFVYELFEKLSVFNTYSIARSNSSERFFSSSIVLSSHLIPENESKLNIRSVCTRVAFVDLLHVTAHFT